MAKKIAVIGAGSSGMTATKQCLDQGLQVVVFEKTNYTGGLWRFQPQLDQDGIASVMKSTIINTSKEMSAFSDFPPPKEFPNFMHNTKMATYFDMYANSFNFTKYVRFRHEIVLVEQNGDYEETGRWKIHYRNLDDPHETHEKVQEEIFDGVMICTGHHNTINVPQFSGQEKFHGTVMHTHSLKSGKDFEDKRVVVVGIGNSGGDAAVELSMFAKQVYLSTRRGTWIFQRVGNNGKPIDQMLNRRLLWRIFDLLPYWLTCTLVEWYLNVAINHEKYQLKPRHRCFSQHVFINDALPNRILSGTVCVKSDIDHFTENGVVFKGESVVTQCDAVILATGYKVSVPFVSEKILPIHQNKLRLYMHQFVPNFKHPHTLALIGFIQPLGSIFTVAEMQSRWFALMMVEKLPRLPSLAKMEKDIAKKERFLSRFYESERHTIQVNWHSFMEELAHAIGVYPPMWRLFFTDFKLWRTLWTGAGAAYQYRLVGPNSWSGAREAFLTVQDRIEGALQTNALPPKSANKWTNLNVSQILLLILMLMGFFSFILFALLAIIVLFRL